VKTTQNQENGENMRSVRLLALFLAVLGAVLPAASQKQPAQQPAGKKLEVLFTTAEIPFTKPEEGSYVAVITVEDNESERFHVLLTTIGSDPNNEKLQVIQMYFLLGRVPKDTQVPIALIKQIAEWNASLTLGKVAVFNNAVMYMSSSWLARTDAETLAQDAVLGHYVSQDLRKEIAPYLKQ
jgi:hypothetical protein